MSGQDVAERVSELKNALPNGDDAPRIEGPWESIAVESLPGSLADGGAYGELVWQGELGLAAEQEGLLGEGRPLVAMLYTYRGISRAIPQVQNQDDPNKVAIYENHLRVLAPEIEKLKGLMSFQQKAVAVVVRHATRCCGGSVPPTPTLLDKFVEVLDMLSLLDTLKNMKACLNNDFSFYKRAFGFLKRSVNPEEEAFNQMLHLFLANQNSISNQLKGELHKIPNMEELMLLLIYHCEDSITTQKYVLPNERFSLLRVIPYVMYLMDGEGRNVFSHKGINWSRIKQLFKDNPVVPLYGDMQTTLDHVLAQAPNFRSSNWESFEPTRADPKVKNKYLIIRNMDRYRQEYRNFLTQWQTSLNSRKLHPADHTISYNAAMNGLFLLSSWTGDVLSQTAWKYASPNTQVQPSSPGDDIADYERVVRYNYDPAELTALVELIGMIKSLSAVLLESEAECDALLKQLVHDEMQGFVQLILRRVIGEVGKKKNKEAARQLLLNVRAITADWAAGIEPNDPLISGQEKKKMTLRTSKKPGDSDVPEISHRAVGPSLGQMTILRSTIFGALIDHFYKGVVEKKRWAKMTKDLSLSEAIKGDLERVMAEFYQRSYYFPHALSYAAAVRAASDLGDLWYKEFYLELDKQRLQFPIAMSLPWILTKHVLESGAELSDSLFFPLSLYNDAGLRAIDRLQRQYLFDEVEGEVNLAFDQLIYKLSSHVWDHHKLQAATLFLNSKYVDALRVADPDGHYAPRKNRWRVIGQQRHLQLLGRHVDVNQLLTERLGSLILKNIDYAISRFEAQELTSVVELQAHLDVLRATHASLVEEGFALDPFEQLLAEADESTSLVSFHGRIAFHVIYELVYDFFVAFNFNGVTQRFTPTSDSPLPMEDRIVRPKMPGKKQAFLLGNIETATAYARIFHQYRRFFGQPHMEAIVGLLRFNMPLIITEVLDGLDRKLGSVIAPYTAALAEGMPSKMAPPLASYGTEGVFGFYQLNLQELLAYPDLNIALQHYKELGNGIIFLNMLEHAIGRSSAARHLQAAPLLGIYPGKVSSGGTTESPAYQAVGKVVNAMQSFPDSAVSPADIADLLATVARSDAAVRPPSGPSPSRSTFKYCMERFKEQLRNNINVFGEPATVETVIPVESTTEFYRVWSAIQFIICYPQEGVPNVLEVFGDGIVWAGAAIIYLLGQHHRFRVLDFSAHTVRVEESTDMRNDPSKPQGQLIERFFGNVGYVWGLNEDVWRICSGVADPLAYGEQVFHPPEDEVRTKFIDQGEAVVTVKGAGRNSTLVAGDRRSVAPLAPSFSDAPPPPPPPSGGGPASGAAPPPPPPVGQGPARGAAPPPPPMGGGGAKGAPLPPPPAAVPSSAGVKLPPPPVALPPPGALPPINPASLPPPPTNLPPPPGIGGLPPPPGGGFGAPPPPPPGDWDGSNLPPPPPPPI